ncbi:mCG144496, partial [Mus musculus]
IPRGMDRLQKRPTGKMSVSNGTLVLGGLQTPPHLSLYELHTTLLRVPILWLCSFSLNANQSESLPTAHVGWEFRRQTQETLALSTRQVAGEGPGVGPLETTDLFTVSTDLSPLGYYEMLCYEV